MPRKQNNAKKLDWKEVVGGQEDFLRPLIREVLQYVMEAEMEDTLGAEKGERTANRQGYRVRVLRPDTSHSGGQAACGFPKTDRDGSNRDLRAISAQ